MDRIGPVWDHRGFAAALVAALLTAFLLAGACSGDDSGKTPSSTGRTDRPEESTPASTAGLETTGSTPLPEATLGAEPESPGVVLRLEGDSGTTFSGICTVGSKESVLSGRVPKRYAFDPKGQKLSCRIQKQDSGKSSLKVILIAGDTTRSVQQTSSSGGVINVSYEGG